jgi:hypothetical protein
MEVGLVEGVVLWPVDGVTGLAVRRVGVPETWRRAVGICALWTQRVTDITRKDITKTTFHF